MGPEGEIVSREGREDVRGEGEGGGRVEMVYEGRKGRVHTALEAGSPHIQKPATNAPNTI